ncbi:MAG: hypothetical protein EAZ42_03110 [Verrucomicrobia bacterium]|nr:MAG: hypothetical protein EAZ42_03110 [Verrucomicrobiota bacterium]
MEESQTQSKHRSEWTGTGPFGNVYPLEDDAGSEMAVKVINLHHVALPRLQEVFEKIGDERCPPGVMPMRSWSNEGDRAMWGMPLILQADESGQALPNSLQIQLGKHPGNETSTMILEIAAALARLHECGVVHGNLKPSNLLLGPDHKWLVADAGLGNQPGAADMPFTDAILYQAPDQLRINGNPEITPDPKWDVYAFGALAYRALTGKFPRCHDVFCQVTPLGNQAVRSGVHANLEQIAQNLEANPLLSWSHSPLDQTEQHLRQWIERCLVLDPADRPANMNIVANELTIDLSYISHVTSALNPPARSNLAWWAMAFAAVFALIFALLWIGTSKALIEARLQLLASSDQASKDLETALALKSGAENLERKVDQKLQYEREVADISLSASRLMGDRLFSWAMEKGNRRLPPLDGRELRLKQLETFYQDFLKSSATNQMLDAERKRAKLHLAEISLALGDASTAEQRLGEVMESMDRQPQNAEMRLRMATNALLFALMRQSNNHAETGKAFENARLTLGKVPKSDVDQARYDQLTAVLDLHEAQWLASRGNEPKALEQLLTATQTLNRLADEHPQSVILRSELAACYLSSATLLEGMGNLGDAHEARALASSEIATMLRDHPKDFDLRQKLSSCYFYMAEQAVLSADLTSADRLSSEALKIIDELLAEQPEQIDISVKKAGLLGLQAGLLRDRGFSKEAFAGYEQAIRTLDGILASSPDHAMAQYRMAQLWWQQGRMLGMSGDRKAEIDHISKANHLLEKMTIAQSADGPRPAMIQYATAYLLGDLGHALQMADRTAEAKQVFQQAIDVWQDLATSRPQSEEFSEGLAWCRQRFDDLK